MFTVDCSLFTADRNDNDERKTENGMRAEVVNDFLQIYPENEKEETDLVGFHKTKLNRKVGALFQKVKDGKKLPVRKLIMIQITKKGVKV